MRSTMTNKTLVNTEGLDPSMTYDTRTGIYEAPALKLKDVHITPTYARPKLTKGEIIGMQILSYHLKHAKTMNSANDDVSFKANWGEFEAILLNA